MARSLGNKNRLIHAWLIVLSFHVYAYTGSADPSEVSGRVVGPAGHAIPNARVYALHIGTVNPGRRAEVTTDAEGMFQLKNVPAGKNEIHAYAPDKGYPDNLFAFFQTAPVPTITLKDGEMLRRVVVQLGSKPGTLSAEITDKDTRKPLPTATVILKWADRPEFYIQSSVGQDGRFTFKVPNHPLLITVSCRGYRTWNSPPTQVPSGQTSSLTITMVSDSDDDSNP